MDAVARTGAERSASISIVAPALGEALVTIALGLVALSPLVRVVGRDSAVVPPEETAFEDGSIQLDRAAAELHVSAEAVVAHEWSTADAILREARARDADMVVVGARSGSWLERLVARGVPAEVVNRARRSVLVLPPDRGR